MLEGRGRPVHNPLGLEQTTGIDRHAAGSDVPAYGSDELLPLSIDELWGSFTFEHIMDSGAHSEVRRIL
jgi:hypothetical protein